MDDPYRVYPNGGRRRVANLLKDAPGGFRVDAHGYGLRSADAFNAGIADSGRDVVWHYDQGGTLEARRDGIPFRDYWRASARTAEWRGCIEVKPSRPA